MARLRHGLALALLGALGALGAGHVPVGFVGPRALPRRDVARSAEADQALKRRYVPGRRVVAKRKGPKPAVGMPKTRRDLGWLLIFAGLVGILSEPGSEMSDMSEVETGLTRSAGEWAYSSPAIETGSILMARPGDTFVDHQQYFHKSVILVLRHENDGDQGIIINRPSGFNTAQLGIKGPVWNIWFGGDCEGIRGQGSVRSYCLHVSDRFKDVSTEVTRGVYLTSFQKARELVTQGRADASDFMLFLGYCGWGRNQLQGELDRGVWKMASVDSRLLVRELREESLELRRLPSLGLDDGVGLWRHLYAVVDSNVPGARDPFESDMLDFERSEGDAFGDVLLRQWVIQNLTPHEIEIGFGE
ncbi:unnamed protein product [Effrenium voratum]|uniref:YqgE/AlgH family protein n=1 Tax=Effrenium voratum TaxID=2562239 RepID=A0AA36I833_9DINO|nr:unnamed protein product [Effrenium voratum]CAJ1406014.1 unnamed protein product [Effrenium voratum]CAJ1419837.1 unnamed protein product [Effrenium voratum]